MTQALEIPMHHFVRAADIKPTTAFARHASGYRRCALSDRSVGAVHTGWGLCELDAGGRIDRVQVYTVARTPSDPRVGALEAGRLEAIAARVRAAGFAADVYV